MSWKDYQNKEVDRAKQWKLAKRVILSCAFVSFGFYGLTQIKKVKLPTLSIAQAPQASLSKILADLSFDTLQNAPHEVKVFREGEDWTLQLTFDSELQKFIYDKLRQYQVDWAGVSVIDSRTGAVKALVSYSSEEPDSENLSLRATFPAASIFKMVTAGAAVQEKHLNSDSILTYGGDSRYVHKRFLTTDKGAGMTLGDAFAHSTNGIFGKVGVRYLGKKMLANYASAFGFNEIMPFEFPVQESAFNKYEDDMVTEARTAAGLGNVTLSPIHASLIAASIANHGVMMKPYSIERVMDANQAMYFEAKPEVWKSPLTRETSMQIQKMMRKTITSGTARKGFRDYRRDSILSGLDIGGKTGSLTGKNPGGKNEWFVGYADDGKSSLAVGIVIVNKKFWKIKPSELAKSLIRYHFKGVKDSEPKAITAKQLASGKKATL